MAPDICVICGQKCGSLKGRAKSWSCAGKLSRLSRDLPQSAVTAYAGEGKAWTRELIVTFLSKVFGEQGPREVLEFHGTGQSVEAMRAAFPSAVIVTAEMDKRLWPKVRDDARRLGLQEHLGPISTLGDGASNWDFAWFDFTGPISASLEDETTAFVSKQHSLRSAAMTVMPEREADGFLARSRTVSIPAYFAVLTGCTPKVVVRYERPNKHEMWLIVGVAEKDSGYDPQAIRRELNNRGYYCHGYFRDVLPWVGMDVNPSVGRGRPADPTLRRRWAAAQKVKGVRFAHLTPPQKDLVRAMLDADYASKAGGV